MLDQTVNIPDQMQIEITIAGAGPKLIQGYHLVTDTLLAQLTGSLIIDVILRPAPLAAVPYVFASRNDHRQQSTLSLLTRFCKPGASGSWSTISASLLGFDYCLTRANLPNPTSQPGYRSTHILARPIYAHTGIALTRRL